MFIAGAQQVEVKSEDELLQVIQVATQYICCDNICDILCSIQGLKEESKIPLRPTLYSNPLQNPYQSFKLNEQVSLEGRKFVSSRSCW